MRKIETISGSVKLTDMLSTLFVQKEQMNESSESEFSQLFEKEHQRIVKNDSLNVDMQTQESLQKETVSSNVSEQKETVSSDVSEQMTETENANSVDTQFELINSDSIEKLTEENHKEIVELEKENKQTKTISMLESFLLASVKNVGNGSETEDEKIDKQNSQWNGVVDLTSTILLPETKVEQGEMFVISKVKNKMDAEVNEQDVQSKENKATKTDVQSVSSEQDVKVKELVNTTNRDTISTMVKKEIMQHIGSVVKIAQPDKIVVQLKPIDLGTIEVTVEKIDGEIIIRMKSENKDVQELLDSLVEEMQDEMKTSQVADTDDTSNEEREKEDKTKEEFVVPKKEYEEKELDLSFEEMLTNWIGGNVNGRNNGYRQ